MFLFGSYATNNIRRTGNIAIAVKVKNKKNYRLYIKLKETPENKIKAHVDLVFVDSMNPVIRHNFNQEVIKIE